MRTPRRTLSQSVLAMLLAVTATTSLARAVCPLDSCASTSRARGSTAHVCIPNTRRIDFVSRVNGHRYSISVAVPFERAPAKGYGVLYVLDGNTMFPVAAEAARALGSPPIVVVGIGYPEDAVYAERTVKVRGPVPPYLADWPRADIAAGLERTYDLTLPASDQELRIQHLQAMPGLKSADVGGLEDFLKTIEMDVKPRVATIVRIDPANEAFFGHSFGGLAVLHALFVEPNAFRTFIIASPSIWWNNQEVLRDEARFSAAVSAGMASPRILVAVGSEESTPVRYPPGWGIDRAAAAAEIRRMRMVENGRELVERLKRLRGGRGYVVEDYAVYNKQSHSLAGFSALAQGIHFAFATFEAD
jgi:uncharacterized protein